MRYPVVLGENDYTGRLFFYVDHIIHDIPMNIDNLDAQIKSAPDKSIFEPLKVEIKTNNKITVNNTPLEKCSEDIINYLKEKVDE